MNHDAVDYFRVDFTVEDSIVGGKHYPLGAFAAEMLALEWSADADIRRPLARRLEIVGRFQKPVQRRGRP